MCHQAMDCISFIICLSGDGICSFIDWVPLCIMGAAILLVVRNLWPNLKRMKGTASMGTEMNPNTL